MHAKEQLLPHVELLAGVNILLMKSLDDRMREGTLVSKQLFSVSSDEANEFGKNPLLSSLGCHQGIDHRLDIDLLEPRRGFLTREGLAKVSEGFHSSILSPRLLGGKVLFLVQGEVLLLFAYFYIKSNKISPRI